MNVYKKEDECKKTSVFMARRAIPIIAFHGVESIYIYIYMFVATCATMRCIRS